MEYVVGNKEYILLGFFPRMAEAYILIFGISCREAFKASSGSQQLREILTWEWCWLKAGLWTCLQSFSRS